VSAGILFKADKPNADTATTFSIGAKGLKGAGGNAATNDGVDECWYPLHEPAFSTRFAA
jgi:hypothetical protein